MCMNGRPRLGPAAMLVLATHGNVFGWSVCQSEKHFRGNGRRLCILLFRTASCACAANPICQHTAKYTATSSLSEDDRHLGTQYGPAAMYWPHMAMLCSDGVCQSEKHFRGNGQQLLTRMPLFRTASCTHVQGRSEPANTQQNLLRSSV
jgi:hypothetical protein